MLRGPHDGFGEVLINNTALIRRRVRCPELRAGSVILMCDNTPSAMILPTSIFDFLQESDDYYFPPTVGTYLRLVRLITLLGSILLIPLWLVALDYADSLPAWLGCVVPRDDYAMPIVAQLLLVEILVDGW